MILNNRYNYILFPAILVSLALLYSCKAGKNDPGRVYAPDMFYSQAYETYYENPLLPDSMGALLPPDGTIPYYADAGMANAFRPYPYPNTPEGYEAAGLELRNPLASSKATLDEGKRIYNIYCGICHGAEGNGKGTIVTNGKYKAIPPSYFDAGYIDMPEGKMFHSLHYGKNAMGSYAYAIDKNQRWQIVSYIKKMQQDYLVANGLADANVEIDPDAASDAALESLELEGATMEADEAVPASSGQTGGSGDMDGKKSDEETHH